MITSFVMPAVDGWLMFSGFDGVRSLIRGYKRVMMGR
ncbi:hypothetical protein XFLM_00495 [Xylella fastidiosa subsp. fastidiosa GB514]|nr:hypothetical protein XFLM_00495 [Xylella fastidiosa subsp. fastidiosa GB514]AIC13802.1 hypothetical protein P303_06105 [Xylella fastidiosa MUL0034]KAF0570580.1 hypothetical protein P305_02810 [Xylella fastidiosa subsp. fastidiosa Mus-1]